MSGEPAATTFTVAVLGDIHGNAASLWTVTHRRVAYDVERTIAAIGRSGQPNAQRYLRMLREANWFPAP